MCIISLECNRVLWLYETIGLEEQGLGFGAEVEEEVDGTEVGEEAEACVEDLGIGRELRIEN